MDWYERRKDLANIATKHSAGGQYGGGGGLSIRYLGSKKKKPKTGCCPIGSKHPAYAVYVVSVRGQFHAPIAPPPLLPAIIVKIRILPNNISLGVILNTKPRKKSPPALPLLYSYTAVSLQWTVAR